MKKIKLKSRIGESICSLPKKEMTGKVSYEINKIRKEYPIFVTEEPYEMFSVDAWQKQKEEVEY